MTQGGSCARVTNSALGREALRDVTCRKARGGYVSLMWGHDKIHPQHERVLSRLGREPNHTRV